jgi:hypothetical protein
MSSAKTFLGNVPAAYRCWWLENAYPVRAAALGGDTMAAASLTCQATPTPTSWSGCAVLVLAGTGGACRQTCAITGDHSMAKSVAAARTDEALAMLLAGRSAPAIVSHLTQSEGIGRRQAQRYVAAAYATLRGDIEEAKVDRGSKPRSWCICSKKAPPLRCRPKTSAHWWPVAANCASCAALLRR